MSYSKQGPQQPDHPIWTFIDYDDFMRFMSEQLQQDPEEIVAHTSRTTTTAEAAAEWDSMTTPTTRLRIHISDFEG